MAAGLFSLSYTQRHDLNGLPYPGSRWTFLAADTDDKIDTYREPSLAVKNANPLSADAFGVLPAVWIADTILYFRVRVEDADGNPLSDDMVFSNLIPATGEGDPPTPIPATAVFKTGDLKWRWGSGIHEGWLPFNGRTYGSSGSGSDYASDDNEALFLHHWGLNEGADVVGGEGDNAAADWAANKRMTMPDAKGRGLIALDNMDDDAAGVLTGLTALAQLVGSEDYTLVEGDIPEMEFTSSSNGDHAHTVSYTANNGGTANQIDTNLGDNTGVATISTSTAGAHTHTGAVGTEENDPISLVQPGMGMFLYVKL